MGAGVQAWNQLWAISVVRELTEVTVFSRDPVRRNAFAARASAELGLLVVAATTPRETVEGKDLVVLATNSPVPVIEAAWVKPGSYVTTLGPKQFGRAEFGPDLVARAEVAVTDSLAQTAAYDPPFVLTGTVQLAGTETYLLAELLG